KEAFFDWFVIDADTYTTSEDIAKKFVMNKEALINAGFSYQYDPEVTRGTHIPDDTGDMWYESVENAYNEYDSKIYEIMLAPGVSGEKIIAYDYKLERATMFNLSYHMREDDVPYAMSYEYYSSELLSSDADSFEDSTEFTIQVHNGDSDNGLRNVADWMRKAGKPAQHAVDYVDSVTFVLDRASNSWLVKDRVKVSSERVDVL